MQALAKTPPEKTRGARLRSSQKRTRAEAIAAELFRRLQADAYRDGRLPSQRQLAESFGVSRGTVARALEYLERNGWIATSARRRPVLTPPERVFSGKLNGFLDASHFRPPLVNAAFDRKDRRNGESTSVIDLSVLCHEHWDEHINFDIESEAVERALGRFARGETDIYRTTGIPALKAAICRYLAPYGIVAKPSEIAVISRRLQAYRLVAEVLLGHGAEMWFPELSLVRHYGIAERHTTRRRLLEMDADGQIDFEAMYFSKRRKVVFLEPSRQKPTGASIPEVERRELVEVARGNNTFIFEDAYCELLDETHLPSLASFDPEKKAVIHLGAIPTWLTPVAGISFIVAHERIINLLRASARRDYLNPEFLTQLAALEILESHAIDEMLERFNAFHRARRTFVQSVLEQQIGGFARWQLPGSFGCIWVELPDHDIDKLYRARKTVDFQPGWFFGEPAKSSRHVLLRYTLPAADFAEGVARFAELCRPRA